MSEAGLDCGTVEAWCICGLPPEHEGPHECRDWERCGGSWTGGSDGRPFRIVRFPGSARS